MGRRVIPPRTRDPRLVAMRRGGSLSDADHRLLAVWAAACAQHVLRLFEEARPGDDRPRKALEQARAWALGDITMAQARAAAPETDRAEAGGAECRWQRARLPRRIRALVLDDQRLRNSKYWSVFDFPSDALPDVPRSVKKG
jgi:hypothetical protein